MLQDDPVALPQEGGWVGPFLDRVAAAWGGDCGRFEQRLNTAFRAPDYLQFLAESYDGRANPERHGDTVLGIEEILSGLLQDLHAFVCQGLNSHESVEQTPSQEGDSRLLVLEAFLNAALLGYTDEQYAGTSLRSLFHFLGRNLSYGEERFSLTLSADGLFLTRLDRPCIRRAVFEEALEYIFEGPVRAPRLSLMGLPATQQRFLGLLAGDKGHRANPDFSSDPEATLLWIRVVQREACLLTEEWEFENAVLAHAFMASRQDKENFRLISKGRDALAIYLSASLAELAAFVSTVETRIGDLRSRRAPVLPAPEQGDLLAEAQAAAAALLASLQKIFLPASVSRHDYHLAVASQVAAFAAFRLEAQPQDHAMRLTFIAARAAAQAPQGASTLADDCLAILQMSKSQSTLRWFFSHDPSPSLKAFSWALAQDEFLLLVLTFAHLVSRKQSIRSGELDENWSSILLSCLQMPQTFPPTRFAELERRSQRTDLSDAAKEALLELMEASKYWFSRKVAPGLDKTYQEFWNESLDDSLGGAHDF